MTFCRSNPQKSTTSLQLTIYRSNLSIARSHAIVGNVKNALALINYSLELTQEAASQLSAADTRPSNGPLNVDVSKDNITFLGNLLMGELQRHRAIVHIDQIREENKETATTVAQKVPLMERLHDYPVGGVDLTNIVEFPPKLALIPAKPIFLDVAWNYIDYPGKISPPGTTPATKAPAPAAAAEAEKPQPTKRGWFGFGRS